MTMTTRTEMKGNLRCPICQHATQVKDSRATGEGIAIRRRRRCMHCDLRFTTFEVPATSIPALAPNLHAMIKNIDTMMGALADLRKQASLIITVADFTNRPFE